MPNLAPAEIREYLAGLALATQHEIEELRRTPVDTKLRELWALMQGASVLAGPAQREAGILETRRRWLLLYRDSRA